MKKYAEVPEMELIRFGAEDVITTSGEWGNTGGEDEG